MARLALALACWLVPTVAAADGYDAPSQAPGETAPDLQIHAPPPRTETRPWEVRAGAGVGFGRFAMLGEFHSGVGVTLDVDALRWFGAFGAGVYLTGMMGVPVDLVMSENGNPMSRDLAWEIEPELAVRSSARIARNMLVGWKLTGSAGVVIARTEDSCGKHCGHVLERSTELGMSAGAAAFAHVGPIAVDLGPRMQLDTAGDRFLALQASAGAVW